MRTQALSRIKYPGSSIHSERHFGHFEGLFADFRLENTNPHFPQLAGLISRRLPLFFTDAEMCSMSSYTIALLLMSRILHISWAVRGSSVSSSNCAIASLRVGMSSSLMTREHDIVSVSPPRGLNEFNVIVDKGKALL